MSSSLRDRLRGLVSAFTASIVDAVRGSSLQELVGESPSARQRGPKKAAAPRAKTPAPAAPSRSRARRLPRRSMDDISAVVDQIAELLARHSEGLRAEQIRAELHLSAKELPRPLKEGLDSARFAKSGQKRATTYFVKRAGAGRAEKSRKARKSPAPAPASEKAAKPRARPSPRSRAPETAEAADSASNAPVVPPPPAVQES